MKRQGRMWQVGARVPVWMALGAGLGGCSDDGPRISDTAGMTTSNASTSATSSELTTDAPPRSSASTTTDGNSQGETQATTVGVTSDPTSTGTTDGVTTGPAPDMGPACVDTCVDGTCVGELCCPINQACTDTCCAEGEVCSFQSCVVPGDDCVDATDCPPDAYCEYTLGEMEKPPMCMGGVSLTPGKCLPTPPECPEGVEPVEGEPITCLPSCEVKPPVDDFGIVLKAAWGGQVAPPYATDVMMSPIVAQLDDDNCDGKVNEKDIPEIIFSTFTGGAYYKQGTLHAISLIEGEFVDKFSVPNVTQPGGGLAAADLDGDGVPEIVGCMNPGPAGANCCDAVAQNTGVIAFKADGTTLWTQPDTTKVHCGNEAPVIGDVDQDGQPEVLIGWTLLDGKTGAIKKELDPAHSWGQKLMGLADVDGDGFLDALDGQRAIRADGTVIWDLRNGPNAIVFGYHAVGDFDLDGNPEVVVISSGGPHTMSLIRHDPQQPGGAAVIRKGVDINNGISTKVFCNAASEYGGGPPTVADFDGDGFPDVGAAGAVGYIVFSGKRMMDPAVPNADLDLWFKTTKDCSSAVTGSSVFDFDGNGKAEVVYADELYLRIYDGTTGDVLTEVCNTSGTLHEYPLVADVDGDGQADIVVTSNSYSGLNCLPDMTKTQGVRVFGDTKGQWVRTRRVWNQHSYHVTNIGEDGTVPVSESNNWSVPRLNNFRQNVQPEGEFSAPDLVVSGRTDCFDGLKVYARVRNLGQASVPSGVKVGFYEGDPDQGGTLLGTGTTTKILYPAEAQDVLLELPVLPSGLADGSKDLVIVVDDTAEPHTWTECRTDNNKATLDPACKSVG